LIDLEVGLDLEYNASRYQTVTASGPTLKIAQRDREEGKYEDDLLRVEGCTNPIKLGFWSTSSSAFRCPSNLVLVYLNVFTISSTTLRRHSFLTMTECLAILLDGAGKFTVILFFTISPNNLT
jgi:hypothetical protein